MSNPVTNVVKGVLGLKDQQRQQAAYAAAQRQQVETMQRTATAAEAVRVGASIGAAGQRNMNMVKTPEEKTLDRLLCLNIPVRQHTNKYFAMAGDPAYHASLTQIFSPWILERINRWHSDMLRVGWWSADEYFDYRQIKYINFLIALKSVTFAGHSTEREQLTTNRIVQDINQSSGNTSPRESTSFLYGLMR
jgi:hypothetical protein